MFENLPGGEENARRLEEAALDLTNGLIANMEEKLRRDFLKAKKEQVYDFYRGEISLIMEREAKALLDGEMVSEKTGKVIASGKTEIQYFYAKVKERLASDVDDKIDAIEQELVVSRARSIPSQEQYIDGWIENYGFNKGN